MADPTLLIRRTPPKAIQGTLEEITTQLKKMSVGNDEVFTVLVPGEVIPADEATIAGPTLSEILAPLQQDFDALAMSDEEHAEWIESLVKKACEEIDSNKSGSGDA